MKAEPSTIKGGVRPLGLAGKFHAGKPFRSTTQIERHSNSSSVIFNNQKLYLPNS